MAKVMTVEDIKKTLVEKNVVSIPGLGKLRVVDKAARVGRNPATGEAVQIAARKVVKFTMSSIISDEINGVVK